MAKKFLEHVSSFDTRPNYDGETKPIGCPKKAFGEALMSKKNISTFGSWLYSQPYLIGGNKNRSDIVDTKRVRNQS